MHAGASGYKVKEVCEKVNELGLGDWLANRSKSSSVSSAINKVHIPPPPLSLSLAHAMSV